MTETLPALTATGGRAPVILFAYNRPRHLAQTVASLLANPESVSTHLTIYCDAPKRPEHSAAVEEVRHYVESVSGFASVTRVYRQQNLGLARSIIDGVTQTLRAHDSVIVLEDDLELSPFFLQYMNSGLDCYRHDEQVASIHGYWYPTSAPLPETFFLKGADCWGWATWSRAWAHFEPDGQRLLADVRRRKLSREIDYEGNYPHIRILKRQISGKNDSWAIRWHISCYLRNMLTLYPSRSLVQNIGHDDSGTNCRTGDSFANGLTDRPVDGGRVEVQPNGLARDAAVQFFRARKQSLMRKVWQRLQQRMGMAH
jgi:hypothetical protein